MYAIFFSEDAATLKKHTLLALMALAFLGAQVQPIFGVSKETVEILERLDALQTSVQNLQKTVDTQGAVLKTLLEQTADNVNSMKSVVNDLRGPIQQNLASTGARFDTMTTQIQALSDSLDETKARLSKLSDQMAQMQRIMETPPAQPNPAGGTPPGPGTPPTPPVPDADSLYSQGLSSYNGGQWDLSIQAFQEYLKYYKDTDRASNAQFYIGECYWGQGDYNKAIEAYDLCSEKYPTGNKAAAAQLKKGFSLLALDQRAAGIRELKSVIQRFPDSHEAVLASQRLKKLGISVPVTTHKKPS
jgi:tol-pal system protein YbgF